MKKLAVLLAAALFCQAAIADVIEGKVVAVADGDTITVIDDRRKPHRIRLVGIDAPEKRQAFGQRSKQSLSDMVYGKRVSVIFDKRDHYDRILGKVVTPSGDANLAQVRAGMAWHYKRYSAEQPPSDRTAYAKAEKAAKREGRGLWADKNPVEPWDWRKASVAERRK